MPNGSGGPSAAIATYDPSTGRYATPAGHTFRQGDLATASAQRTWQELLPA